MITSYPDKNSLKEVMNFEFSISGLRRLCRNNGIFLLSNNKEDIVKSAHLFYWGYDDINLMSQLMEDQKNYKKSFRLAIDSNDGTVQEDENTLFMAFYGLIASFRTSEAPQRGISFDSFTIIDENGEKHIKAEVEHNKRRRGRVKLLDEVEQRFTFDAFAEDNRIIVDVIFDDRSSVQIAKTMMMDSIAPSDKFKAPKQISLKALTTSERVDLFDRFFAYQFSNWAFEAVKNIKVQTPDEFDDSEEDAEEIENNFLAGIESALLSGSGLRANPIVVDAVNRGYFFPKASVMFNHRHDAVKLLLDISFNTEEFILELSILSTYEIEDDRSYKHPLQIEEQEKTLQYFHSVLAKIYKQIVAERRAM